MKQFQKIIVFLGLFALLSCSVDPKAFQEEETDQNKLSSEEQKWINEWEKENQEKDVLFINGYVSPYEIVVDKEPYNDSEAFYTAMLEKLEKEKDKNGYGNYTVKLNADIGFDDLKNDMLVSVIPKGDQGYTGEDILDYEGKFSIKFPIDAENITYVIRATKKIDVSFENSKENIRWCYNFMASKTIKAQKDNKPFILKNFQTKITKYGCVKDVDTLKDLFSDYEYEEEDIEIDTSSSESEEKGEKGEKVSEQENLENNEPSVEN